MAKIECYDSDCKEVHDYDESEVFSYYDAEQGKINAVICKSCGLSIQV